MQVPGSLGTASSNDADGRPEATILSKVLGHSIPHTRKLYRRIEFTIQKSARWIPYAWGVESGKMMFVNGASIYPGASESDCTVRGQAGVFL